jgi:hypothetical protein
LVIIQTSAVGMILVAVVVMIMAAAVTLVVGVILAVS